MTNFYVMTSAEYDAFIALYNFLQENHFEDDGLLAEMENILDNIAIED